ncbi:MAG: B12-binding domain-containing radical SAM protein [Verrucomicrobia bacterium RIFCSPLOWO2_12_FULL_64_8]|nr:MAG: B12-binding domain-containing radical SAM protein [Verrucomicrobia bacterium RIFCSPLOWO2_12_FULL_64_8]
MKIGFLAISGIRVVDGEIFSLGLNLPGFVERRQVIASLPSLGLLTLAGMTPDRHEIRYVEIPDVDAPELRGRLPGPFDAVAISSFSAGIKDAYRLADRYRREGVKVVLGGLHVALCPDEAEGHADAIVVGEGEPVWPQVLNDLEQGTHRKRYATTIPFDLAEAPMPRFDLLEVGRYNRLTIQTSRGCPWDCEFCAASVRLHPTYRTKPAAKVVAELHRIKEIWSAPFIEFADDNTFADRRHGHALMDALEGEHVRWFTETDISVAQDGALLRKMRRAGCAQVLIGLEDPDYGTEGMELKANWKARQRAHYLDSIHRIQDQGITVNGCFVLGLDTHTPESFDRLWEFIQRSGLFEIQLTILTPFPGTPLHARLDQEGRLLENGAWEKCTLFDVMFQPAHMTPGDLRRGLVELAKKVYSAEFTEHRRRSFVRRKMQVDDGAFTTAA